MKQLNLKHNHLRFIILLWLFIVFPGITYAQDFRLSKKQASQMTKAIEQENSNEIKVSMLLKLSWFYIAKPGEIKTDLDSANTYLKQSSKLLSADSPPTLLGFYAFIKSLYLSESGQKAESLAKLDLAIHYLVRCDNYYILGSAYEEKMFRVPFEMENIPYKIKLLQLATAAFLKTSDKRKLGDCLRLMADLRTIAGLDHKSLAELDSAKTLYQQAGNGDWQQLFIIYTRYYLLENNYEKALESALNGLRSTDKGDSSVAVFELNAYVSSIYFNINDHKQSIVYAYKALQIAEKLHDVSSIYNITMTIMWNYTFLGFSEEQRKLLDRLETSYPEGNLNKQSVYHLVSRLTYYDNVNDYATGQKYLNTLLNELGQHKITDGNLLMELFIGTIPFCIHSGQFKLADSLLREWQRLMPKLGYGPHFQGRILRMALSLDTNKRDYKSAVDDLIKLTAFNDSLYSSRRINQLKDMEVRYQVELKEKKILLLSEQQKNQRAELKNSMVTKKIMLICLFFALLSAGLVYRQYLLSRKNNQLIKDKNNHLQQLVDENEWLIKEMHHRVKNNFQMVNSLLNAQSKYLNQDTAQEVIKKIKGRVESISLIHQKLYKTQNQTSIYMPEYIQELVDYLKESSLGEQEIWFNISVDLTNLHVSEAVPIGLIINECLTNSIKYAFSDSDKNEVSISLEKTGEHLALNIRDNGKGFVAAHIKSKNSFGLVLINGLAEDLGGMLDISSDEMGTRIRLDFKPGRLNTDDNS